MFRRLKDVAGIQKRIIVEIVEIGVGQNRCRNHRSPWTVRVVDHGTGVDLAYLVLERKLFMLVRTFVLFLFMLVA